MTLHRIVPLVLTVALALVGASCDSGGGAGKVLDSTEGKFAIAFPPGFGEPKLSTHAVDSPVGVLTFSMYIAEKPSGACFASYNDYPPEVVEQGDPTAMLDGARDGALRNINGKLIKEEEITLDGHPGRSISFSGSKEGKGFFGRADIILAKPRLYQVMSVAYSQSDLEAPAIRDFFKSFQIKK